MVDVTAVFDILEKQKDVKCTTSVLISVLIILPRVLHTGNRHHMFFKDFLLSGEDRSCKAKVIYLEK